MSKIYEILGYQISCDYAQDQKSINIVFLNNKIQANYSINIQQNDLQKICASFYGNLSSFYNTLHKVFGMVNPQKSITIEEQDKSIHITAIVPDSNGLPTYTFRFSLHNRKIEAINIMNSNISEIDQRLSRIEKKLKNFHISRTGEVLYKTTELKSDTPQLNDSDHEENFYKFKINLKPAFSDTSISKLLSIDSRSYGTRAFSLDYRMDPNKISLKITALDNYGMKQCPYILISKMEADGENWLPLSPNESSNHVISNNSSEVREIIIDKHYRSITDYLRSYGYIIIKVPKSIA